MGRTDVDTIHSIPDPTLSLKVMHLCSNDSARLPKMNAAILRGVQIAELSRRGQNPEKSLNFFTSNRLVFLSRQPSNTLESRLRGGKMRML